MQTRSRLRLPTRGWLVATAACIGLTFAGAGGLGQLIASVEQDDLDVAGAALRDRLSRTSADVVFFGASVGTVLGGVEDPSEVTSFFSSMAAQSAQSSMLSSGAIEAVALHRNHRGTAQLPDMIMPLGLNLAAMSEVSQPLLVDSFEGPSLAPLLGNGSVRYLLTVPVARPDDSHDVLAAVLNPAAMIGEAVAEAGDEYLSVEVRDVTDVVFEVASVSEQSRLEPSTSVDLAVFGREWSVDVWPGPNYPTSGVGPAMITTFAFGSVAALLLVVAGMLDRRRREHLQQQVELAEELVQSKDRFIASVSHELRTPLTAVRGFAEVMSGMLDDVAHDIREMARAIADQSGEMSYLIDDLLVAARAEVGAVSVLQEVVDAAEVVHRLLGSLPFGAEVQFSGPPEPVNLIADRHRVRQILHNLIANAHRYGGDRIRVEIAGGSQAVLSVLDDGAAIPWEAQQQMFAPYEHLSVSTSQPASVGLGLTVARELARLMGGDLEYHRRDRWNVFVLTLPSASATRLARAG